MNTEAEQWITNPILSCCEALFSIAAPLRDDQKAAALNLGFREQAVTTFTAMEKAAFNLQIGMVEFKDAQYAMAAYLDEAVLTSTWPGRAEWMSSPFQLTYFGEHTAGEGFFNRLSNLRQGGESNVDLIELYYYCLQLGFQGMYKIKGVEHLMALQVDLRSQIDSYRGPVKPQLSPAGLPANILMSKVHRNVPHWVIGVVTVATVFFTYVGYSLVSNNIAEKHVAMVVKSKATIEKLPEYTY